MRRNFILLTCALLTLLGAIVAALATKHHRDYDLRGYVDATRTQELPFRIPRLGVNAELLQYPLDELPHQFELMVEANVVWVRQFVRWDETEPAPGHYQWKSWDAIVKTIADYPQLRLVAVLGNTPTWARRDNAVDDPTSPPADFEQFADFVFAFAERYGHAIHHYQVWDEPNILLGWGGDPPQAIDYTALLQTTYGAIHSADRNATVIAAALAPTVETGPDNISDITYLRELYAAGAADFADAFAAKPYGFNFSPYDRDIAPGQLNFSRIIALREIMVEHDDGGKALWGSNFGWNALPDDWQGDPSIWGSVSGDEQARYIAEALERADREWPWLGGLILHHWQPDAALDDPQWGFSIIEQDDSLGPLWTMLAEHPSPASASNGLYAPRNPFARYSGTWTFSDLGADVGWTQDSRAEFDFEGQDIALLLREDDYVAYFYPTIDDEQPNAIPQDSAGNAYIQLRSGDEQPHLSLVRVADNLADELHTLRILANELISDEINHRWPLVGYAVSSGNLDAPYNRQIAVAWITVVIAGVAVLAIGWQIQWQPYLSRFSRFWNGINGGAQIFISFVTSWALLGSMLITWGDGAPTFFRRDPVQLGLSIITAGFIYINEFGVILTIAAAIVLGIIIYNRLELGVLLTLFWVPFFLSPIELYQFAFPIAEVVLLITTAAWLLHVVANWGRSRQSSVSQYPNQSPFGWLKRLTAFDWLVLAWVILGCLSLLWTQRRSVATTELRSLIIQPALFYLILRTIPHDRQTVKRLVGALLLAGIIVSVLGVWMWLRGDGVITAEGGARRLTSVYGSPNNVGLFLGRCVPFALAFLFIHDDQRQRNSAGIVLAVMGLAVLLSQSVGALFIGMPAAVVSVIILTFRRRAVLPLMVVGIVLIIGFLVALQSPRFSHVLDFSSGTNFYRLRVWQSSLNLIGDHPFTGAGLDQFLYDYSGQYILPDAWEEPYLSHPHNFLLDFWVRLGVLGVLLFAAMQTVFWREVKRLYDRYREQNETFYLAIVIGLAGSMVNVLAHGLVDNSVFVLDLVYVFMLLFGLPALLSVPVPKPTA
jgi:O-antigen ligase